MNTPVKIFIILNLLIAMAFCWIQMTVYATRENWKRRWDQETRDYQTAIEKKGEALAVESFKRVRAQNDLAKIETQLSDAQAAIKKLETVVTEREKDIQTRDLALSKKDAEIQGLLEDNRALSGTLEQTRQRNTELTHIAQVARAVAFQLNVKLAEVEDDYNNATTELAQRKEDIAKLTTDLKDKEAKLALVLKYHPNVWKQVNDEKGTKVFVQGIVAAIKVGPDGKQDLVMLTVGKEEQVAEGMEFVIFRGNQYIVKVRAERVLNDMVACRVIPEFWNANGLLIQQGDLAQNRL